jgi:hypothetical protein
MGLFAAFAIIAMTKHVFLFYEAPSIQDSNFGSQTSAA